MSWCDIFAVITGIISAFFWFLSARVDMSTGWGGEQTPAQKKAALLNTLAASFSALSILASNVGKFF